jgi:flagellar assembly protein FliH
MGKTKCGIGERTVEASAAVSVFAYPACPGEAPLSDWRGWVEAPGNDAAYAACTPTGAEADRAPERTEGAEENTRTFAAGRKRGLEEGRALERQAHAAAMQVAQDQRTREYAKLAASFSAASESYLNAMEREVVKLALAVAARILRREAQMDPLLLTGAARVALGQLAANSEVRLRVPAAQVDLWKEAMALVPNRAVKPAVVADEEMRLGDCAIESKAGTVDLGVRSQLDEIERRFFDRVADLDVQPALDTQESAASEAGN